MLGSTLTLATVAALFSNPNVVDDDCWHRCAKERALHCKSFPGSNACVFNHCGFWWDPVQQACLRADSRFAGWGDYAISVEPAQPRQSALAHRRVRRYGPAHKSVAHPINPQIEHNLIYVKLIKAASSTTGGIARRVCVFLQLHGCTNQKWPETKIRKGTTEPGLWANHKSMHALWPKYVNLVKPNFTFTVLRDPAQRAMSHYYHFVATRKTRTFFDGVQNVTLKKGRAHDKEKLEFIQNQRNWQFHYACMPRGSWDKSGFRTHAPEAPRKCIKRYRCVGLAERFDESVLMLRARLIEATGHPIPMSRFWYVSAKVSTHDGGREHHVPHIPLEQETEELQRYVSTQHIALNQKDYSLVDLANKALDTFIHTTVGAAEFESQLGLFQAQMKVVAEVCGKYANEVKTKCYWNDNGCNYECLDQVAEYLEQATAQGTAKNVREMANNLAGHPDVLELVAARRHRAGAQALAESARTTG